MDAFLNNYWTLALTLHLFQRKPTRKGEARAVIFYSNFPLAVVRGQPHQYMFRSTVLANIDQSLLHDTRKFAANLLRHIQFFDLAYKAGGSSRFPLEPLYGVGEECHN